MEVKTLLGVLFALLAIALLSIYYFIPFNNLQFTANSGNYNFSIDSEKGMQFYANMRFPHKEITYKIHECSIKKAQDMRDAFHLVENQTILEFRPVSSNEEITIICNETVKFENRLFVAGEGGPDNIIRSGKYSVIVNGTILLRRESQCERPNIAIHELMHVLGFNHSDNSNNIMYPVTNCKQTLGDQIPELIDELYSVESLPDLVFEDVYANMYGRYLNINFSVKNIGLADADSSVVKVSGDGEDIKDIEIASLDIGSGRIITTTNIRVSQRSVEELNLYIDFNNPELDKENNNLTLVIKNEE